MKYEITGVLYRSNERFKIVTSSLQHAMGINLWRGSVWEVNEDGKRKLIKEVTN
tara:strand:+ start:1424 stop:1585 length:162 start_codon:yes stop_codon:yes gene_type:complete